MSSNQGITSVETEDAEKVLTYLESKDLFPKRSRWLVTGAGGFLGTQLMNTLSLAKKRGYDLEIVCVDSSIRGENRQRYFESTFEVVHDVTLPFPEMGEFTHILHLASIASPKYYRQHPLETINSNYLGTINVLELAKKYESKVLLMSSSEIYGDPTSNNIPTKETYRGNVSTVGPRACYDEGKRVMETLGWIYNSQSNLDIAIARPFNFFGPGMRLDDARVLPDMIGSVVQSMDIILHSDGTPTRSFCYVSDATRALLELVLCASSLKIYNIGNDSTEISILELASLCSELGREIGWKGSILQKQSSDPDYLVNNPQRRVPDLNKIKNEIGWEPIIGLKEGLTRMLKHYIEESR